LRGFCFIEFVFSLTNQIMKYKFKTLFIFLVFVPKIYNCVLGFLAQTPDGIESHQLVNSILGLGIRYLSVESNLTIQLGNCIGIGQQVEPKLPGVEIASKLFCLLEDLRCPSAFLGAYKSLLGTNLG